MVVVETAVAGHTEQVEIAGLVAEILVASGVALLVAAETAFRVVVRTLAGHTKPKIIILAFT